MNRFKRTIGLAAALLSLLVIVPVAAQSSFEMLTIGFIGASEGQSAEFDRQLYQAAVLAAEQINAGDDDDAAGVRGPGDSYQLEVVYYEADTPAEALDAYYKAVDEGAVAVLGPHHAEWLTAITDDGTPDVAIITGLPEAEKSSRVLRAAADYETWAEAAADYLENARAFTKIAVVTSDTGAAADAVKSFKKAVDDDLLVVELTNDAGESNFDDDARAIRDAQAEAVFAWMLDAQTTELLAALERVGWDGVVLAAGVDQDFLDTTDEALPELMKVLGLVGWTPTAYDAASRSFVLDYEEQWRETPPEAAAAYYDAVYMIAVALSKAGDKPSSVATRLSGLDDFEGVQGVYDDGVTEALRIVQVGADGGLIEAARYNDGECMNCSDTRRVDTTAKNTSQSAMFNIGLITAGSGSAQDIGENIEQAVRLALREINNAGGVVRSSTRYTLNLKVYTATTADEARIAFQEAVADGMNIVIGPDANAQILADLNAAANAGLVQLVSATSSQIALTDVNDMVFQLRATDDTLAATAANYLLDVRGLERLAFVAVQTDYGLDSADTFADVVSASDDGELALRLEHAVGETDFSSLAEKIAGADVEAVAVWSTSSAASGLLAALDDLGWDGVFVYGYLTPDFAAQAAGSSIEVIGPAGWWASGLDWASQDFVARFNERYDSQPLPQSAAYYDAVYLIAAALEDAGSSSSSIQSWLSKLDSFTGVQGVYHPEVYDTGELTRAVMMLGVGADGVYEIARYDDLTCQVGCE
ncbi:MAG: ABC transporter substrate-binding protein [Chloroflexi bacterium]|nr:ABC transporter substrate-binding protein [Chloroflexota bacterium]